MLLSHKNNFLVQQGEGEEVETGRMAVVEWL